MQIQWRRLARWCTGCRAAEDLKGVSRPLHKHWRPLPFHSPNLRPQSESTQGVEEGGRRERETHQASSYKSLHSPSEIIRVSDQVEVAYWNLRQVGVKPPSAEGQYFRNGDHYLVQLLPIQQTSRSHKTQSTAAGVVIIPS